MSYSFTSIYRGGDMCEPSILWQGKLVAVVIDRDRKRARLQLTYFCSQYGNLSFRVLVTSGDVARINALIEPYCAFARAVDAYVDTGGWIVSETLSHRLALYNGRGGAKLLSMPSWIRPRTASRLTKATTRIQQRLDARAADGASDHDWYVTLVQSARDQVVDGERKALLAELLRANPTMTATETLAEVDRRLPERVKSVALHA